MTKYRKITDISLVTEQLTSKVTTRYQYIDIGNISTICHSLDLAYSISRVHIIGRFAVELINYIRPRYKVMQV